MSVTYNDIFKKMKSEYTRLSGVYPHEASDIIIRMKVLAGEIYNSMVNIEWLKRQMLPDTALGEFLDYHAEQRGLSRTQAQHAEGTVFFSRDTVTIKDTVIPKGTVVATKGENPVYFETVEEGVILNATYSIDIPVRAMSSGFEGNVSANAICVIVTPISGVVRVTNTEPCEFGTDIESDESLRRRILESYKAPPNGTNISYYKKIAESFPSVSSASVVPRGRGMGTVDVYVASSGAQVSDETLAQVQERLNELREINVDVKVHNALMTAVGIHVKIDVLDGYEFDDVKSECIKALREYISTRGVGGSFLLTEAGDRIQHTAGVKEYTLNSYVNYDVRCDSSHCPKVGTITVEEGVVG